MAFPHQHNLNRLSELPTLHDERACRLWGTYGMFAFDMELQSDGRGRYGSAGEALAVPGSKQCNSRVMKAGCLLLRGGSAASLGPTIEFGVRSEALPQPLPSAGSGLTAYLSLVAGCRRDDSGSTTKTDASRGHPHHHERVRDAGLWSQT